MEKNPAIPEFDPTTMNQYSPHHTFQKLIRIQIPAPEHPFTSILYNLLNLLNYQIPSVHNISGLN